MTYAKGQTVPFDYRRGITGDPIAPTWHALTVPPQRERATCEILKSRGVYAFYPSQERKWRVRGRKIVRTFPIVSGHVYALFRHAPNWDVMKEQRRIITGVFAINGQPIEIPADIVKSLQGLTVEAKKLQEAREQLMRIRTGDRATIAQGPLAGFLVDVEKVEGGMAWFRFLTGGKGRATVKSLERKVEGDE